MDRGQITLLGSAACVMLTMHFTIQLLSQHLFYWKNPKEQKAIVIIILMAPIYAIVSFVGLVDIQGSKPFFMFLGSIKECYEALVSAFSIMIRFNPMILHFGMSFLRSSVVDHLESYWFFLINEAKPLSLLVGDC